MALLLAITGTSLVADEDYSVNSPLPRFEFNKHIEINLSRHEILSSTGSTAAIQGIYQQGKPPQLQASPINLRVERRLENLWALEVPASQADKIRRITYTVTGPNGEAGYLCLPKTAVSISHIHAEIEAMPVRYTPLAKDKLLLSGDAILYLDISEVSVAGAYNGALSMTVEYE